MLAGALAAAKLHVPIAHLEAGLRSLQQALCLKRSIRALTDHISTLLLCPTATAVGNLRIEGIVRGVHDIGDVMYDAMLFAAVGARLLARCSTVWGSPSGPFRLRPSTEPKAPRTARRW